MKKETEILYAKKLPSVIDPYIFMPLSKDSLLFKNRSLAWKLDVTPKEDPAWQEIYKQLSQYNGYTQMLDETPGFLKFFIDHEYGVSKDQVTEEFGAVFAERVFAMPEYPFYTPLVLRDQFLMEREYAPRYRIHVPGFGDVHFEEGELCSTISTNMNIHNILLWNWSGDDRDLTYMLYDYFDSIGLIPSDCGDTEKSYAGYDCYDQHRDNMAEPDKNLLRCMELLEHMGYLVRYKLRPEVDSPWFVFQKEGSYGTVATLDYRFKQDSLLMEKLRLVLNQPEAEVEAVQYFLTDKTGKQYLSDTLGQFGGHRKLKIYGKLDCPSANRHIADGDYVRHRVFFADEETAIASGYRPCGVCMKEKYQEWKARHPD